MFKKLMDQLLAKLILILIFKEEEVVYLDLKLKLHLPLPQQARMLQSSELMEMSTLLEALILNNLEETQFLMIMLLLLVLTPSFVQP